MFNTLASPWAELADVLPILLFQIIYLWLFSHHLIRLGLRGKVLLMAGFFGLTFLTGLEPELLNGSIGYLPSILFLIGLGVYHLRRFRPPPVLLMAGGLFQV